MYEYTTKKIREEQLAKITPIDSKFNASTIVIPEQDLSRLKKAGKEYLKSYVDASINLLDSHKKPGTPGIKDSMQATWYRNQTI